MLIDGKLVAASDGGTFPIVNPATGQEIGVAPDATAADVDAAIAAARRAFDETDWSTNHEFRVHCLRQLHQALVDNAEQMRALTTAEVGAPAFLTAGPQYDVPVRVVRWTIDLAESYDWETDLGVATPMGISTATHDPPRSGRRGRRDHAVELPEPDQPGQGRPRARGRQHRRAQAGTGHALGRVRARPAGRRAHRHPAGRLQRGHPARTTPSARS